MRLVISLAIMIIIVFGFWAFTEILRLFIIYFLEITFDFFDFIAYGFGVELGIIVDRILFKKFVPFWSYYKKYFK